MYSVQKGRRRLDKKKEYNKKSKREKEEKEKKKKAEIVRNRGGENEREGKLV